MLQPVGDPGDPGDPGARPGESVTGFYRLLVWCDIVLYGVFVGMLKYGYGSIPINTSYLVG